MVDITWPEQIKGVLDDIFAVKESYDSWKTERSRVEAKNFYEAVKNVNTALDPVLAWNTLIDNVLTGQYGQYLEAGAEDAFNSTFAETASGYLEAAGTKIKALAYKALGVSGLDRDQIIWGHIWKLMSPEQMSKSLEYRGVLTEDQPILKALILAPPDPVQAGLLNRRWSGQTGVGANWYTEIAGLDLFKDWFENSHASMLDQRSALDALLFEQGSWSAARERFKDFNIISNEVEMWYEATRHKFDIQTLYNLSEAGGINSETYNTVNDFSGGHSAFTGILRAQHEQRFNFADVLRWNFYNGRSTSTTSTIDEFLRSMGFMSADKDLLDFVSLSIPSAYELLSAERKIRISEPAELPERSKEIENLLKLAGVHPKAWQSVFVNSLYFPPVQDLITMAVRETFTPSLAAELRLFEDLPDEFVKRAEQQGVSAYWAEKYWGAHWQLPSATEGMEMLHRGIIDSDEFKTLLRVLDYSPVWRDKLEAISYNVYTRVDVRRMYAAGILNYDQVIQSYMDGGYDEEHAINLARFVQKQTEATLSTINANDVISEYVKRSITRAEASSMLFVVDVPNDLIPDILARADFQREREYENKIVAAIERAFKSGKMSIAKAKGLLSQYRVSSERIEFLTEIWTIEKTGMV